MEFIVRIIIWMVLSVVLLPGARGEVEDLNISKNVVFMANGNVTLTCSFKDPEFPHTINFTWHHKNNLLVIGHPTLINGAKRYSYQLIIHNATRNDAGRYSCNIAGDQAVVYTTLMQIAVDDSPVVGEIASNRVLNLLSRPDRDVRCFTAEKQPKEITSCKMYLKLEETDVGYRSFVIVSKAALLHYQSIDKAIAEQVTFELRKQVIGLAVFWTNANVSFVLTGNTKYLTDMSLSCFRPGTTIPLGYAKEDSTTVDKKTVTCHREDTMTNADVTVHWKGKILYDTRVTETSGSSNPQMAVILVAVSVIRCVFFRS